MQRHPCHKTNTDESSILRQVLFAGNLIREPSILYDVGPMGTASLQEAEERYA